MKNHHDDALKLAHSRAMNTTLEEDLMECPECGEKFLRYADDDKNVSAIFVDILMNQIMLPRDILKIFCKYLNMNRSMIERIFQCILVWIVILKVWLKQTIFIFALTVG